LKFKFTDAYRNKSETTKSLLGEPGSPLPGLMEMQVPKMKRAKRTDGFYGWHVHGALKKLKFDPSSVDVAPSATLGAASGKSFSKPNWKKPPGLNFPAPGGVKDGDGDDFQPTPPAPPPPPRPTPETPTKPPDQAPAPPPPPERAAPAERPPPTSEPAATERSPEPPPPPPPAPTPPPSPEGVPQ